MWIWDAGRGYTHLTKNIQKWASWFPESSLVMGASLHRAFGWAVKGFTGTTRQSYSKERCKKIKVKINTLFYSFDLIFVLISEVKSGLCWYWWESCLFSPASISPPVNKILWLSLLFIQGHTEVYWQCVSYTHYLPTWISSIAFDYIPSNLVISYCVTATMCSFSGNPVVQKQIWRG